MTSPENAVTPERFLQGKTWQEWLESVGLIEAKYRENYEATRLNPEELNAIRKMIAMPRGPNVWGVGEHGPGKVLALVETSCPDVYRGLPVVVRLCEATGMELRIFDRDENLDIMGEFLNKGEFRSVPTFVFYTKIHEYLGHWIERPIKAREEGADYEALTAKLESARSGEDRSQIEEARDHFERGTVWDSWRQAQVRETRLILQGSLERAAFLDDIMDTLLND